MDLFLENIINFIGQTVIVTVQHIIYGDHQVKVQNFTPLYAQGKIGVSIEGHDLFVYEDELQGIDIDKTICKIVGTLQTIKIAII